MRCRNHHQRFYHTALRHTPASCSRHTLLGGRKSAVRHSCSLEECGCERASEGSTRNPTGGKRRKEVHPVSFSSIQSNKGQDSIDRGRKQHAHPHHHNEMEGKLLGHRYVRGANTHVHERRIDESRSASHLVDVICYGTHPIANPTTPTRDTTL